MPPGVCGLHAAPRLPSTPRPRPSPEDILDSLFGGGGGSTRSVGGTPPRRGPAQPAGTGSVRRSCVGPPGPPRLSRFAGGAGGESSGSMGQGCVHGEDGPGADTGVGCGADGPRGIGPRGSGECDSPWGDGVAAPSWPPGRDSTPPPAPSLAPQPDPAAPVSPSRWPTPGAPPSIRRAASLPLPTRKPPLR
jgi:hypothetical protein